jgi:hypothetical protein
MQQAVPAQSIFLGLVVVLVGATCILLAMMSPVRAAETDAKANRIRIEYFDPLDPTLRRVYELAKERRPLERIQEIFSPFRLPIELTLRARSCERVANAW